MADKNRVSLAAPYDEGKAKAAAAEVVKLNEKLADLNEQVNDVKDQIAVKSAEARVMNKPGFSNVEKPKKELKEAEKETLGKK